MIENLKTAVLWVLICTSLMLTWFIWSYQPEYRNLEAGSGEYIVSEEIGETRSEWELIYPMEVLIHDQEEISWLQPLDGHYRDFMELLTEIEIENFEQRGNGNAPSMDNFFDGVELVYNEPLQRDWIDNMFVADESIVPEDLDQIDRLILLENPTSSGAEIILQFISTGEEVIYHANTSLTTAELERVYQGTGNYQTPMEKRVFNEEESSSFQSIRYVPLEPVSLKQYTYETTDIPIETFVTILFSNPNNVVHNFLGSNSESYHDGNRQIHVEGNDSVFKYVHTSMLGSEGSDSLSLLESGVNFINGHYGWTDDYYVSRWGDFPSQNELTFRMHVDGIPVFGSNRNRDFYTMSVGRSGNQITEYNRPLFELDNQPFEQESGIELPSFETVEEHIEENETFSISDIEDIRIGHYMFRQRSFATFEPAWFVRAQGGWTQLDISTDSEVSEDGLE